MSAETSSIKLEDSNKDEEKKSDESSTKMTEEDEKALCGWLKEYSCFTILYPIALMYLFAAR